MDKMNPMHTFAICAYKESPYLEECVASLAGQTVRSNMFISTSTDNAYIRGIANKYQLPVYINEGKGDMQDNWNFAYSKAETPFVTVCHQDDYYMPEFAKYTLAAIEKIPRIIMLHTNYYDVVDGKTLPANMNKKIKTFLNFLVRFQFFAKHRFFRKLALSFGNSICCPSVTYNREIAGPAPFHSELAMAVDWDLFYTLADKKGTFVYHKQPLTVKRLHRESGTNETIQNGARYRDDVTMFSRIWPKPIASVIVRLYKKSYEVNDFS